MHNYHEPMCFLGGDVLARRSDYHDTDQAEWESNRAPSHLRQKKTLDASKRRHRHSKSKHHRTRSKHHRSRSKHHRSRSKRHSRHKHRRSRSKRHLRSKQHRSAKRSSSQPDARTWERKDLPNGMTEIRSYRNVVYKNKIVGKAPESSYPLVVETKNANKVLADLKAKSASKPAAPIKTRNEKTSFWNR